MHDYFEETVESFALKIWQEEREELKRLRIEARMEHWIAATLYAEARKIHQACDRLDAVIVALGGVGPSTP